VPVRLCPILALALLCVTLACARHGQPVNHAPLTSDEARLFEHGIDFVGRVSGLEGRWRHDYERDLAQRVASSDVIAIVMVRRSRTDRDPEQRITHRLYGDVERTLRGSLPGPELELLARQGERGFMSIDDNLGRLHDGRFVAYVKWYETESGALAGHFHLSPASDDVIQETESKLAQQPLARSE
jgi:hypothetical protein